MRTRLVSAILLAFVTTVLIGCSDGPVTATSKDMPPPGGPKQNASHPPGIDPNNPRYK